MNESDKLVVSKLKKIAVISLFFMSIQIVGGALAHSIAIMADAFHLLSDVIAYVISLYSVLLGTKIAPKYLTFGYQKAQPLGALINVAIIWFVTIQLFIEATDRIVQKEVVQQPLFMLLTSIFGLGCNLFIMRTLHSEQGHHHGHDHGHHHGHGHGHQNELHQQHDDHDQHDHDQHDNGHNHHGNNHKKHNKNSQILDQNLLNGYVQSVCSCPSQTTNMSRQQSFRSSKISDSREADSPLQLSQDLAGRRKQKKNREYCSVHSTDKSSISNQHNQKANKKQKKKFENINMQAAYIHIISDIILSIGVIISASVIYFVCGDDKQWSNWQLADPFCTYLFSVVALYSTIPILKQSIRLLLDGCQNKELVTKMKQFLKNLNQKYHDYEFKNFRLWSSNRGKHYCALNIQRKHIHEQCITDNHHQDQQKQYQELEQMYEKIKKFCKKSKISSYIDVQWEDNHQHHDHDHKKNDHKHHDHHDHHNHKH